MYDLSDRASGTFPTSPAKTSAPASLFGRSGTQVRVRPAGVRLLLDQNLSARLLAVLGNLYPGSTHVREIGLQAADDDTVCRCAAEQGFVIVSKDADCTSGVSCMGTRPR